MIILGIIYQFFKARYATYRLGNLCKSIFFIARIFRYLRLDTQFMN